MKMKMFIQAPARILNPRATRPFNRQNVPICDIARERRGLVEGHADPLLLTPNHVTGNVRAVCLKDKVEMLGDVLRLGNIQRRPRNGNVAD